MTAMIPDFPKMVPCEHHSAYAGTIQHSKDAKPELVCPVCIKHGDVPLENQTRESLIALVESMDKQAKDNEKRRADLEELALVSRKFADWKYEDLHDHGIQPATLSMDIRDILRRLDGPLRRDRELDAVTPTQEKKE